MADSRVAELKAKPGAWVDLGLTLPIFVLYHLGVVFLGVKNGTDFLTGFMLRVSEGSVPTYLGITLALGVAFAIPFVVVARGQAFQPRKFIQMAIEGTVYATFRGVAVPRLVGAIFAGPAVQDEGRVAGFIMSLGAGFYEELSFRVVLFGLGGKLITWLLAREKVGALSGAAPAEGKKFSFKAFAVLVAWSVVCAMVFSAIHYIGPYGDTFQLRSFVARLLLGLVLTFIFSTRGFATAVWTHAIYDVWVLVLRV